MSGILTPMEIMTRSGATITIDDDRHDLAAKKWFLHGGYPARVEYPGGKYGKKKRIFLHHEVLGVAPVRGGRVDHIDRDPLNNRASNLRVVTPSENAQNRSRFKQNGLPRGVSWKKDQGPNGKFVARATINYKRYHIGYFDTAEEAGSAASAWRAKHMTHSDESTV